MGTKEIEEMQQSLIGKTVKGVLIRRRQNAYFVKWSQKHKDVYVSAKNVERCLGPKKQPGMVVVVKCTITGFGPSSAALDRQNPLATELTVATRYPSKNVNNPYKRRGTDKSVAPRSPRMNARPRFVPDARLNWRSNRVSA